MSTQEEVVGTFVENAAGTYQVNNDEHEAECQAVVDGATAVMYREWEVTVWPATPMQGPSKDQQASARAVPVDKSKLPADKPNASVCGARFQTTDGPLAAMMNMRQVMAGLNRVLAAIDRFEDE